MQLTSGVFLCVILCFLRRLLLRAWRSAGGNATWSHSTHMSREYGAKHLEHLCFAEQARRAELHREYSSWDFNHLEMD